MALTGSEVVGSATPQRAPGNAERGEAGWIARWAGQDPVRAIAAVLIVVGLAWRAQIASRGYLAIDDFPIISRAAESDLTADFLFRLYSNHLMPAGMLITGLTTRATGLAYWPYVLTLTAGQAVLSVAFYRLLRLMLRPGWGLLIPLCVLLFSPLTLELTSWWASGMNVLPMQLAMVLAVGAQVKYVRTRRARHLVTLGLSLVLGLLFFEKSLLIVPLVFLLTACLFVNGGPVRSIAHAVRRYWPSWLVLAILSLAYLQLYTSRAKSSLRESESAHEVLTFLDQLVGHTLVPGLLGGPWRWLDAGDGPPVTAPAELARWLAWAAFITLVVVTVQLRRVAIRAWILLALYVALVAGLLAATRLGSVFSGVAGLVPRYVGEVVVVGALCIGIAVVGLRDPGPTDEAPAPHQTWPAVLRQPLAAALVVLLAALGLGTAWSASQFSDDWAVKHGRDYLQTARTELATAPPGTVFFDRAVPDAVVPNLSWPYNLQSHFFWQVRPRPVFVTEAANLSTFDEAGHIRPASVEGTANQPGPVPAFGHCLNGGQTIRVPLTKPLTNEWQRAVRIAYLSTGESTAVFRLGGVTRQFQVHSDLNQFFFLIGGGGDAVELTIAGPDTVRFCTNEITLGEVHPKR